MREIKFRACDAQKKKMLGDFPVVVCVGNNEQLEDLHVMQFTGLKDKNGKEIYEGDIIEGIQEAYVKNLTQRGILIFSVDGFCLKVGDIVPLRFFYGLRVIGNIYENPDLLA